MPSPRFSFSKLSLLQQFSVLTALSLSLLGWVLSRDLIDFVEGQFVEMHEETAVTTIKSAIGRQFKPTDFTNDLTSARKASLDEFLLSHVINDQIIMIKCWSKDGTVTYATEKSFENQSFEISEDLEKAYKGELKVEIHSEELEEKYSSIKNFTTEANKRYLEVYIPYYTKDASNIVGVFEVYWDLEQLDTQLSEIRPYIISLIIGSQVILFVVLYGIVSSASKRISSQNRDLNTLSLRLNSSLQKEQAAYKGLVNSLLAALDAKDKYTAGHSLRVADYAVMLGKKLQLSDKDLRTLEEAALFHDIGKIGVGDYLLQKPNLLSAEEYQVIKAHPVIGSRIVESMAFYGEQSKIVRYHHEHWDGSGYPEGLKGEEIPMLARILTVADIYDALTSDRPYRKSLPFEEAKSIMIDAGGKSLDPDLVDLFFDIVK